MKKRNRKNFPLGEVLGGLEPFFKRVPKKENMNQILESLSVLLIPLFDEEGRLDPFAGILWCVFVGVLLVFLSVIRQNATLGKALQILREKGATDEESALPAEELEKLPASAYKGNQTLLATVEKEGKCCVYLPEKSQRKADALLKTTAAPLWLMLLELVGFYAVLKVLFHLLPWVFSIF